LLLEIEKRLQFAGGIRGLAKKKTTTHGLKRKEWKRVENVGKIQGEHWHSGGALLCIKLFKGVTPASLLEEGKAIKVLLGGDSG